MPALGIDIGGANLKAATSNGQAASVAFPIWKRPHDLRQELCRLVERFPACDRWAITMTAELADCFPTKARGVLQIAAAVESARGAVPAEYWTTDGRFVSFEELERSPLPAAAANWHALAEWIGSRHRNEHLLLIDLGSTTTDIIPVIDGRPAALGNTDPRRLASGELLYVGASRTPLCAFARWFDPVEAIGSRDGVAGALHAEEAPDTIRTNRNFGSTELCAAPISLPMAAEWFATTRDLFLLTGESPEDVDDRDTANGQPATRDAAWDRFVRQFGADREEIGLNSASELARRFVDRIAGWIGNHAAHVAERLPRIDQIMISGSGAFLARRAMAATARLASIPLVDPFEGLPPNVSDAACAFAVAKMSECDEHRPSSRV